MPISFDKEHKLFHLSTAHTSYQFSIFEGKYLFSQYYGKKIPNTDLSYLWQVYPSGFSPVFKRTPDHTLSQDLMPLEYPVYGHGDYRAPAIHVQFEDGSRLLDLVYESHTIQTEKPSLDGLPCAAPGDETLTVTLCDQSGIRVHLDYTVYEALDVITRSARIENNTGAPVTILSAMSMSIDLPIASFDMISLDGTHVRERQITRSPLSSGTHSVESRRGASSHHHNPFVAFASKTTTEHAGEAYGMMLSYSGNFVCSAETDAFDSVRIQCGVNPFDFSYELCDGETFCTPEAMFTYTDQGLNRMSQQLHDMIRNNVCVLPAAKRVRPIVINNWEATYFGFDEKKLLELIEGCRGLGIDTFVLDDGWFGHRDDDTTSLGDWFCDKRKLPNGLNPIIDACESVGMRFGLWFEPEMISEDSELYRAHPDWPIRHPDRPYCLGRQQLVLDLSRDDVLQYLYETIASVLRAHRISYVKWDMNRHITDAYSACLPPARQPELMFRYMKNLYRLLQRLTSEFPDVLFEGCSGGGGRFDAGMLRYHPQIWTSDDTDAIARLRIQYGTSLAYPPVCMTAHVSASPNHQLGRRTPFATRGLVAMSATFGYELNPLSLSDEERAEIAAQTARYHQIAPLVEHGDFYRLVSPFESDDCAWMFVSKDKSEAVCTYVRQLVRPAVRGLRVKLAGLDADAVYHIDELSCDLSGAVLMNAGLLVPLLLDFEGTTFTLHRI